MVFYPGSDVIVHIHAQRPVHFSLLVGDHFIEAACIHFEFDPQLPQRFPACIACVRVCVCNMPSKISPFFFPSRCTCVSHFFEGKKMTIYTQSCWWGACYLRSRTQECSSSMRRSDILARSPSSKTNTARTVSPDAAAARA